ncbi:MAG: hypothetical protein RQ722_06440 [Desulfuromonadales bacterium]|nr:hypothetical protein [Desulfuromonadales bacterium]
MQKTDSEQEMFKEFVEFIEVDPIAPCKSVDKAVLEMVAKDLRTGLCQVFGKLTLIAVASGLLTLTVCPQFGLGAGRHNEYLHALHAATPPLVFYLLCGLFFVLLGAGLSGLVLSQTEIRTLGNRKYAYFGGYSVVAYLVLLSLGAEAFVASSLFWMLGALLGNLLGFESVIRMRFAKS